MSRHSLAPEKYVDLKGQEVGVSQWMLIDQKCIDAFALCTRDSQFIHVDPERAKSTPFGKTIAHGFLTLSLLSAFAADAVPAITGALMVINYGFDTVRFLSPVFVDNRVRGRFRLIEIVARRPGEWLSRFSAEVEIERAERSALVADWTMLTRV